MRKLGVNLGWLQACVHPAESGFLLLRPAVFVGLDFLLLSLGTLADTFHSRIVATLTC